MPSLYDELDHRSLPRMHIVSFRSITICFVSALITRIHSLSLSPRVCALRHCHSLSRSLTAVCLLMTQISYVLVGVAGYIEAPDSTSGNLLNNYCVSPGWMHTHHNSAMMLPAYAAMALSVVMAYPLNIHPCAEQHRPPLTISPSHHTSLTTSPPSPPSTLTPHHSPLPSVPPHTHSCRYTLDIMFFQQFGAQKSALRHILWTLLIASLGLLVSLYVPGINVVFQLMGSTSSAFVCFVLPAAFALKLRVPEVRGPIGCIGAWALLLGGTVLGAIATVSTLTTLGSNPPSSEPMGDESAEQLMAPHVKACSRQCAFLSSPAD